MTEHFTIHCTQCNRIPHNGSKLTQSSNFSSFKRNSWSEVSPASPTVSRNDLAAQTWMLRPHLSRGKAAPAPEQEKKHHLSKSQLLNYIKVFQRSKFSDKADRGSCHKHAPFLLKNLQFKLYREQGFCFLCPTSCMSLSFRKTPQGRAVIARKGNLTKAPGTGSF